MQRDSVPKAATMAAWDGDRDSVRYGIRKHAILHCHDRVQTVVVRDISAGGVKIQNAFGLVPGDPITLELLTRRTLEGEIAWSVPPYCGIKFYTPLRSDDPLLTMTAPRIARA
jgi:PilZ domain